MEFRQWLESSDELEDFYRDNEARVLANPEIRDQLGRLFAADGRLIRRVLGVGSEDSRGHYFIRVFNQRHGDEDKSMWVPYRVKYPDPEPKGEEPIPKEVLDWFRGSKIVEGDGAPKVVHHGTTEKFDRFEAGEFGFHFGDENAAGMMGDSGRFLLKMVNPLRTKDLGTWEPERVLDEVERRLRVPKDVLAKVRAEVRRLAGDPRLDQDDDMVANRKAHYAWSRPVRELIKSLGHDGIVYRNEAEGFEDSYIAFDADQVRRLG